MPRQKEYNRDDVVRAATEVFWAKGYRGASVRDLVAATGLNKQSMYQEFGNKAGLFEECLDSYARMLNREVLCLLSREPLGLANIRAFFENRLGYACTLGSHGCMIVNTAGEGESVEDGAIKRVEMYLRGLEVAFKSCLEAAKERREISANKDCAALAQLLLHVTAGMMTLSKTEDGKASLNGLTGTVLACLG